MSQGDDQATPEVGPRVPPKGDTKTAKKTLRFQSPITRAVKVPTYDAALDEWLDSLVTPGNPDAKLAVAEFKKQIDQAESRATTWETRYYALRSLVIVLAAAVTALAGASAGINGTGGFALKIVTAVLSFIVAAITGILELLRASNRWALYRMLRNNLFQAAWELKEPPAAGASSNPNAVALKDRVGAAIDDFEHKYLQQVLVSEKPESGPSTRK